jgi:hypothetical protein
MSISPGEASSTKVSWVPQVGQKVRVACELERKRAGAPASSSNCAAGTVNQATHGAPVVRRHIWQWQFVACVIGLPARYRIAPQKHPPSIMTSSIELLFRQ